MSLYSKITLSQSSFGKGIPITQTGVSGTLIHQTNISTGILDEVWLYGTNPSDSDSILTLRFGGSGISGDASPVLLQAYAGYTLLCPGFILQGNGASSSNIYGSIASGYSGSVNIYGYINRIS